MSNDDPLDMKISGVGNPVRVVVPMIVGDQVRIGLVRIARPYPDIAAFDYRYDRTPARWYPGLSRHRYAGAPEVEFQPVIPAPTLPTRLPGDSGRCR